MTPFLHFTLILWGVSLFTLSAASGTGCEFEFHVKPEHHLSMGLANFTKKSGFQHKFCTVLVRADRGTRIVMDLTYVPRNPKTSCTSDYVHVGNDVKRVDIQLMTSYKFCRENEVRRELVSRANEMWLVHKASTVKPKDLLVQIRALEPVSCMPDQYRCSPVQCVDTSKICDGTMDCTNGLDEYCLTPGEEAKNSADDSHPCFRCRDGTCISPRLPRYDNGWGRALWYLCDGFNHCDDGWDERPDICIPLLKGRVGSVISCVPFDLSYGPKRKVIMWNDIRCDDVTDCHHAEDELRCRDNERHTSRLYAKPLTICIIAAIVFVAVVIAFICRFKRRGRTGVRPSTGSAAETVFTQSTCVDGHDVD